MEVTELNLRSANTAADSLRLAASALSALIAQYADLSSGARPWGLPTGGQEAGARAVPYQANPATDPAAQLDEQTIQAAQNRLDQLTMSWRDYEAEILGQQGRSPEAIEKILDIEAVTKAAEAEKGLRKELEDKIALTLTSGVAELFVKKPGDPRMAADVRGLDSALSNLDTAYAGGLQNVDSKAAFAHDRAMILAHLKQVESDYRSHANSVENIFKKMGASILQTVLQDTLKKLQTGLSKSISDALTHALGHPGDGGSKAKTAVLDHVAGGMPGAPGSKRDVQTLNAVTLNVANMAGAAGGSAGGGLGSLAGALIFSAFHPQGASSATGGVNDLPVTHRAMGGDVFAGQPFIAGDPGPNAELIMPKVSGHTFTASETRSILTGPQVVHNHEHHWSFGSPEAVAVFVKNPQVVINRVMKTAAMKGASTRTNR